MGDLMFKKRKTYKAWDNSLRLARAAGSILSENFNQSAFILDQDLLKVQYDLERDDFSLGSAATYVHMGLLGARKLEIDPNERFARREIFLAGAAGAYGAADHKDMEAACRAVSESLSSGAITVEDESVFALSNDALVLFANELLDREPTSGAYARYLLDAGTDFSYPDRAAAAVLMSSVVKSIAS